MGFYKQRILPHLIDFVMSRESFSAERKRVLKDLRGTVLEVGFGTGLNLPFYPSTVKTIVAVDPIQVSPKYLELHQRRNSPDVRFMQGSGEALPLETNSMDHVVTTWTLCSVTDPATVLGEIKRVLKPGGSYVFVEHGKSPEPFIAKLQDWLTPVQKRIGGGCHLNRKIDEIIAGSGLKIEHLEKFYMKGFKIGTYLYLGRTTKNSDKDIKRTP